VVGTSPPVTYHPTAVRPFGLITFAALAVATGTASADETPSARVRADLPARLADPDTADGRFEGDLGLVVGAGATTRGEHPLGVLDIRARYLDTAGVYLTYEEGFGANAGPYDRLLGVGIEMRPLFLARWVTGKDLGLTWPDLVIDSLGLELGTFFDQPLGGPFTSRPGFQASVALELPLLARVTGPWIGLRAGGRWGDDVLQAGTVVVPAVAEGFFTATLAWHQLFRTHVVDLHDDAPH
jgi:hypothetical protein